MATCPDKNSKEWKELVASVGNDEAIYLWDKYKGFVPQEEYNLYNNLKDSFDDDSRDILRELVKPINDAIFAKNVLSEKDNIIVLSTAQRLLEDNFSQYTSLYQDGTTYLDVEKLSNDIYKELGDGLLSKETKEEIQSFTDSMNDVSGVKEKVDNYIKAKRKVNSDFKDVLTRVKGKISRKESLFDTLINTKTDEYGEDVYNRFHLKSPNGKKIYLYSYKNGKLKTLDLQYTREETSKFSKKTDRIKGYNLIEQDSDDFIDANISLGRFKKDPERISKAINVTIIDKIEHRIKQNEKEINNPNILKNWERDQRDMNREMVQGNEGDIRDFAVESALRFTLMSNGIINQRNELTNTLGFNTDQLLNVINDEDYLELQGRQRLIKRIINNKEDYNSAEDNYESQFEDGDVAAPIPGWFIDAVSVNNTGKLLKQHVGFMSGMVRGFILMDAQKQYDEQMNNGKQPAFSKLAEETNLNSMLPDGVRLKTPENFTDSLTIMNQLEGTEGTASPQETLRKTKKVLDKMGVKIQDILEYAKGNPAVDVSGVNALADLAAGIVALAEGKEDVALTEEMVHIATAIIEQTNPKLITEMIRKIGGFKIYKDTLAEYRDLKEYQLPNGKPDIRKIKKEAVDKLIAEIIVDGDIEAYTQDARSLARKFLDTILDWFRVNVRKTNIDIFKSTASAIIEGDFEGGVSDLSSNEIYFQLSNQQRNFQNKIEETGEILKKEEGRKDDNPVTNTESDSNNFYKVLENGVFRKVATRVTDYVDQWYQNTFGGPYVAPDKKTEKQNEQKKNFGLKYHDYFDGIAKRYFNSDGTRRVNPDPRPVFDNKVDSQIYEKLEKYFTDLIEEYSKDGKSPLFFPELKLYDSKNDIAGTVDLVIIEEDGTAHIYDWKFMSFYINDNGDLDSQDVPWFKKGAYSTQLREYKRILKDAYNIKKFGKNRFIPIIMDLREQVNKLEDGKLYINGINIGSVNPKNIEPLYLVPVSEESELTGNESIDRLIKQLNTIWKSLELKKEGLSVTERQFKNERMNLLKTAVRRLRSGKNIGPLIDVIETQTTEAKNILDKMSAYMQLPADTDQITEKQKSEIGIAATNYIAVADILGTSFDEIGDLIYKKGDEKVKGLSNKEKKEIKYSKKLLADFQKTTTDIRRSKVTIEENLEKFVDKFIGEANLVTGLSSPEPLLKNFWKKNFSTASAIGLKSIEVLSKMLNLATGKANQEALSEVNELIEIQKRIIESGGNIRDKIRSIYQTEKGNIVNKLIYRYQKAYREEADEIYKKSLKANTVKEIKQLKQWVNENVEIDEYKKEASKILNDLIEKQKIYVVTDPKTGKKYYPKRIQNKILEYRQKYDIERDDFTGYNNYIVKKHPKPKWESKEYIALKKDKPLFDLYNFITKFNEKANDLGYISNMVGMVFLPFIRKGTAEQLSWDMSISPIKQFSNALTLQADTIGYGNINELTSEIENSIPKYYTYDFTRGKDKELDTSELSMELFKNMILYINHVNRYKYLKEIEGQVQALKTTQKFKKNYITGNQDMIARDPSGQLQTTSGDMTNVEILDSFIKSGLYDQKYTEGGTDIAIPNILKGMKRVVNTMSNSLTGKDLYNIEESPDSFSLQRSMDFLNRYIQMKALGGEFISGAVNSFGTTIQLSAQSGVYFGTREVMKKQYEIARNTYKNDEDKDMFVQLVDKFMPLKDDPTYDKLRKAGLTGLTRVNTSDLLFMFFRFPEQLAEKAVFATLLDNTMIVDGKFVNIKDYVRKKYPNRYTSGNLKETEKIINAEIKELKDTKSISATKKLENGKVVVPGLDLNNIKELQKLTSLTRSISRSATGGQTEYDTNLANQNVWMRSAMVFKNWIPKLAGTRFSEFRKITDGLSVEVGEDGLTTGEKYDIGRVRLFFGVLGSSIINQSNDIYNIMIANDKGIKRLDEMFLKYQENLMNKRGETLNLSKEEFYDLIRNNLRNEIKELALMLSLMGVVFAMGMIAPDDDEDKASKNMYRFAQRTVDRFLSELLFFYNPGEMTQTLSGGIPAIGIFKDISRFTSHFTKEITGLDYSNPLRTSEEVRKNAQPIKNAMKLFPISKSFVNYFAIFDEDFAKEFDVTIQKTNR